MWWESPGNFGVVIGYEVDNFTYTRLTECSVTCSQVYPGFMGRMSTLAHFPLEPGYEGLHIFRPICG